MTYSLTLTGKRYFTSRKVAGRGKGNCCRSGEREAHAKYKIPTIKFVSYHSYCKEITTRLGQIQSAVLISVSIPRILKRAIGLSPEVFLPSLKSLKYIL